MEQEAEKPRAISFCYNAGPNGSGKTSVIKEAMLHGQLATGVETYHFCGSDKGYVLAYFIQCELVKLGYTKDRDVKEARFTVLKFTDVPAALVECAFISSDEDRTILAGPDW